MTKEQVLVCMGPAKKKAHEDEGDTDVWSYPSSAKRSDTHCTVNVVMHNGIVTGLQYIGDRGSLIAPDENCAWAIEHCLPGNN
ncbi:MAG TPA: hypothetical protein VFR09_04510 [Alphaproteobacteria bacterium]|nr:hypothetical protein [Alphaproteobacteria bacterium]